MANVDLVKQSHSCIRSTQDLVSKASEHKIIQNDQKVKST